ncbi:MAG: hypothetical protein MSG64_15705 [Pyrinomonadaceae bacterium MAG19_C2-C3]|nr:hypothetical protein [Pyrinomonadaceae bacterium MAG19_C2-C3]
MSLSTRLDNLAVRVGAEIKSLRASVNTAVAPAWHGKLYAARGSCEPHRWASAIDMSSVSAPTFSHLTPTVARCVKFRPPAEMSVTGFHVYAVAASSAISRFAIYRASTGALVWDSDAQATATNAWLSLVTNFALAANTDYWFCFSVNTNGATAPFRTPPAPLGTNQYGADAAPLGGNALGLPVFAQFAVAAGVFPAILPPPAAAAYAGGATGTLPVAFLSASSS